MAKILDQPCYSCPMAAMRTVQSIDKALPILHSGPGCAEKLSGAVGSSGHFSPHIFPCTAISETDIVFGGAERLRETIGNALKVIDADLYVVLTSCASEIIGDDVGEVVGSFKDASKPIVFASTPGFKGNNYTGHEEVVDAIIDQYLLPAYNARDEREAIKGLVNVWASVPLHDAFWAGNYRALEGLVRELGLTPNTIFGYNHGIEDIDKVPYAQFNLVVSPWVGLENAQRLERDFGTPYLHYPNLPIGAFETSKFLRAVGEFAGVDPARVEHIITVHEREYYHYIERFADVFLETRVMATRFVTIADAQYSLALTKFLVNDMGLTPSKQYIVDGTPEAHQNQIRASFANLNYGIEATVGFSSDGYQIHHEIEEADFAGYPLILGSYWDKTIANKTHAHFIEVSWPIQERLVINGTYVGYEGGLKLLEDIYSVALTRFN